MSAWRSSARVLWARCSAKRPARREALVAAPGPRLVPVLAAIATGGALALILAPPWTALDWQPGLAATTPGAR